MGTFHGDINHGMDVMRWTYGFGCKGFAGPPKANGDSKKGTTMKLSIKFKGIPCGRQTTV